MPFTVSLLWETEQAELAIELRNESDGTIIGSYALTESVSVPRLYTATVNDSVSGVVVPLLTQDGALLLTFDSRKHSGNDPMNLNEEPSVSVEIDGVNVVVSPTEAHIPKDQYRDNLYLRLGDTSTHRIESVVGANGAAIDFGLYEDLDLIFETADKQPLEVIPLASMSVINEGRGLSFKPDASTVAQETFPQSPHEWAIRDPTDVKTPGDPGRVICGGKAHVQRFAMDRG